MRLAEEAEVLANLVVNPDPILFVYTAIGRIWNRCGDPERAKAVYLRVIGSSMDGDRRVQVGVAMSELADVLQSEGQIDGAARCLVGALQLFTELGSRRAHMAKEKLGSFRVQNAGHPAMSSMAGYESLRWTAQVKEILTTYA
jgi:hypothetical protein